MKLICKKKFIKVQYKARNDGRILQLRSSESILRPESFRDVVGNNEPQSRIQNHRKLH